MLRIPLKITMISFIPSLSIKSGERGGLRRGERERKRELALFLLVRLTLDFKKSEERLLSH